MLSGVTFGLFSAVANLVQGCFVWLHLRHKLQILTVEAEGEQKLLLTSLVARDGSR